MIALSSCPRWTLAAQVWLLGMLAALLMLLLLNFWSALPGTAGPPVSEPWRVISAVIVAPLLETALLVGVAAGVRMRGPGLMRRAALVALPLAVLHLLNHWQHMLVTLPVFWLQALMYLELRRRGHELLTAATPVVVVHALHNGCGLMAAAWLLGPDGR